MIDRLFRHVEQQAAAGPLGFEQGHGALGNVLMTEEIQFEGFAQDAVIHVADGTLPRRARVGQYDIDAAKGGGNLFERLINGQTIGDIHRQPQGGLAALLGHGLGRFAIQVQYHHFGTLLSKGDGTGRADARTAAGDHGHLTGQRLFRRLAQLGLFQRPIFHIEQIGFGQGGKLSDRFRIGDGGHGIDGNVRGDGRILGRSADAEQT